MFLEKKPRHVRLPRRTDLEIVDETAHLWAISYADFLMVLLCFFVLFFSADRDHSASIVHRIGLIAEGATPKADVSETPGLARLSAQLKNSLSQDSLSVTQENEKLTLLFPDNIYRPGEVTLRDTRELNAVLLKLKPFESEIRVTFVGHTDPVPVLQKRGGFLSDNFDLSSFRATHALQQAVRLGLNPDRLAAQGSAEHERRSRTLSIVIEANTPKEGAP